MNLNAFTGNNYLFLEELKNSIRNAESIDIIVSFLMESGIKLIIDELKNSNLKIRILTTDYLNITQPQALYRLKSELKDHMSSSKTEFLKNKGNIITLIASIPFDTILPTVIPGISLLRYLRLLKLLRVIVLFNRFYNDFSKFISKTNLDKILVGLVFTVMLFTVLLWIFGSSNSLFDYFYFVIVTLTTVGYGDITPQTYNEKVITLALIIIGIFIFSTIPAALSSFLTERLLKKDAKKQNNAFEDSMRVKFESLENELETFHEENRQLREEIKELKEIIKEK